MEQVPCAFGDVTHDVEGREIEECRHCGVYESMDSSRSTRGGSDVPAPKASRLNEKKSFSTADSFGKMHSIVAKVKRSFRGGKENVEESEKLESEKRSA